MTVSLAHLSRPHHRTATLRRVTLLVLLAGASASLLGCRGVRMREYRSVSTRATELYRQNEMLAGEIGNYQSALAAKDQEFAQIAGENARLQSSLKIAEQRVANLTGERGQLHGKYQDLLTGGGNGSGISASAAGRFADLARKYPQFEFDSATGVSKFNADLLFGSGSDVVREEADSLLGEFSQIVNSSDVAGFSVLVVGHTDDKPIKAGGLAAQHKTNWELSAHRATQVVRRLAKFGVAEHRMGAAGYSKYQPVAANVDESSRQQNRRVEIYLLAPDAQVAAFDPLSTR